jgi:hypothetical protein
VKTLRNELLTEKNYDQKYVDGESNYEFRVQTRKGLFGMGKSSKIDLLWSKDYTYTDNGLPNQSQKHGWAHTRGANVRVHTHPSGWLQTPSTTDISASGNKFYGIGNYVYGEGTQQLYKYYSQGYQTLTEY